MAANSVSVDDLKYVYATFLVGFVPQFHIIIPFNGQKWLVQQGYRTFEGNASLSLARAVLS